MGVLSILVLVFCIVANVGSVAALVIGWRSPTPFRFALGALFAGAGALLLGLSGTVYGLKIAFGAVESVAPEHKSELLAEGIAEAMNATAFGIVASIAPFVISLVLLFRRKPTAK